jgi:methylmalonyl-CoA/ethylmalonyl-CoA epimerase
MSPIDASFDHVAHAARSIRSLLPLYEGLLGGVFVGGGDNRRVGFRTVQLQYANWGRVELLEPLAGSSFLDSFLGRFGDGGLHHVTFRVPDINEALVAAVEIGMKPFGVYTSDPNWKEFFIHPRAAGGTLVQLAQSTYVQVPGAVPPFTLEEFLQGGGDYFGP